MKKIWKLLLVVGVVLFIGGCSKETTTSFESDVEPGIHSELTYFHKGDKVTKQTAHNTVTYKDADVEDPKLLEEFYAPTIEQYKGIKGIEHEVKFSDTKMVETLTIDYENLDFEAIKNVDGIMVDGNAKNGVSLKASQKLLESQGFSKK